MAALARRSLKFCEMQIRQRPEKQLGGASVDRGNGRTGARPAIGEAVSEAGQENAPAGFTGEQRQNSLLPFFYPTREHSVKQRGSSGALDPQKPKQNRPV